MVVMKCSNNWFIGGSSPIWLTVQHRRGLAEFKTRLSSVRSYYGRGGGLQYFSEYESKSTTTNTSTTTTISTTTPTTTTKTRWGVSPLGWRVCLPHVQGRGLGHGSVGLAAQFPLPYGFDL